MQENSPDNSIPSLTQGAGRPDQPLLWLVSIVVVLVGVALFRGSSHERTSPKHGRGGRSGVDSDGARSKKQRNEDALDRRIDVAFQDLALETCLDDVVRQIGLQVYVDRLAVTGAGVDLS